MKYYFRRLKIVLVVIVAASFLITPFAMPQEQNDYALRRQKLMDVMGSGVAVFRTSNQSSQNFFYLTYRVMLE